MHHHSTEALVLRKIRELFPEAQVDSALTMVRRASASSPEGEVVRVQLAILKLYDEAPERGLQSWCDAAIADYRDVLFWAGSPHLAGVSAAQQLQPDELKAIRKLDYEQLSTWLKKSET